MGQCSTLMYVGLDVHKESIAVAYALDVHGAEVVSLGNIDHRTRKSSKSRERRRCGRRLQRLSWAARIQVPSATFCLRATSTGRRRLHGAERVGSIGIDRRWRGDRVDRTRLGG